MFVPNLIGYKSFAVISGSMEPNIPVGSIVYAKEIDYKDLKVDDVITYQLGSDTIVTHRIKEINDKEKTVVTKGDANETIDSSPVNYKQIIGKVAFSLPLLGYISVYVKTPLGIAAACAVVFVLLILNFIPEILEESKKDNSQEKNIE